MLGASASKLPSSCANPSFVKDTEQQKYYYSQPHAESYSSKNPPDDEVLHFAGFLVFPVFVFVWLTILSLHIPVPV